jgi:hypothetical protein
MDAQYDPLLDPYHLADETESSAFTPQEIQSLKSERKHDTANHIRGNVFL